MPGSFRAFFFDHAISDVASRDSARIIIQTYFPSPGAAVGSNPIGDPGLYLAEHILRLSPDLPSFEKELVEIALTVDEIAKHGQTEALEIKNPGPPASGST
jgi:hypothetical protein